ncbi:adhesion G-protein coupled receptor G2 [Spea bombifrons]|uniref:adhesion G-protein coupled receptor G2 n=1 Tax=Spea bombifrons TaxID=233779 RepID=UPI002349EFB0|nr:adhesion G-protein coupled receptor G2 [Spea bombifrons]
MVFSDQQPFRTGNIRHFPKQIRTTQQLCFLLCLLAIPQIAQTAYFGEYKAVFKKPCTETMRLNISVPDLSQFTVCTYIKLASPLPWTAFAYKLPTSKINGYEVGLFGDSSVMQLWMFGKQITVYETLKVNTWHETCIIWDGKKEMSFYLDGLLKNRQNIGNDYKFNGGGILYLGCLYTEEISSASFPGLVGEMYMFRMWNSADEKLLQKCIDGTVIQWNMSDWIYTGSTVIQDSTLHCAKKDTSSAPITTPAQEILLADAARLIRKRSFRNAKPFASSAPITTPALEIPLDAAASLNLGGSFRNAETLINNFPSNSTPAISTTSSTPSVESTANWVNSSSDTVSSTSLPSKSTKGDQPSTFSETETPGATGSLHSTFSSSTKMNSTTVNHFSFTSSSSTSNITVTGTYDPYVCKCNNLDTVKYMIKEIVAQQSYTCVPSQHLYFENPCIVFNVLRDPACDISSICNDSEIYHFVFQSDETGLDSHFHAINESTGNCSVFVRTENISQPCTILQNIRQERNLSSLLVIKRLRTCCCPTVPNVCPTNLTYFNNPTCEGTDICTGGVPGTSTTSGSHVTISTSSHATGSVNNITSTNISPIPTTNKKPSNTASDLNRLNQTLASGNLNSSVVDSIVSEIENMLSGEVSPENAVLLVGVLNTFLNISEALITPVSKRLILIVDKIGLQLTFPGQAINITSNSLALAVNKVNASSFTETSFGVDTSSGLQVSLGSQDSINNDGSIILPASLLNSLSPGEKDIASRVQFNFYEKTSLFVDNSLTKNQTLVSKVISSSVGNITIRNLSENVTVTLKTSPLQNETQFSMQCVFWDFNKNMGKGGWESSGCMVANSTQNETVCKCNHLTSFAILMDVSRTQLSPEDTLILTFITYIGCGISAIFLSVTLVTYIAFEKIRRDYPSKILIQLCAALVCLNLTFLLNPWIALYNDIPGLCISVAAFLHYFLLVSITWMGLEAFHMYLSLVKVFNTYVRKYMLKFCIIGWGLPAVVVAIILAVNKDLYGLQSSGKYPNGSSDDFCWIHEIIFYVTVVGYFGIIFLLNVSMFIVVLIQLCRIKKQKQLGYQRKTTLQDLRSVAGITVLLGITWGLAFFSWGPGKVVIIYLFTIFNTLQGFFIFIFYCVAKENVRKQWRRYLCCGRFRLAENSDWSKTATNKLKKQTTKQGVSSSSSNSIQSTSNSNSTTLLISNEYFMHQNGNGSVFKERNGVSFKVQNGDVSLNDFPDPNSTKNGDMKMSPTKRTSNRGSVHFVDQM